MSYLNQNVIVKNIYHMLSYAFLSLNMKEYEDIETEDFDNVYDLFSEILNMGLSYQIKKGLYKEYVDRNDNLYTVKGKININRSIKNHISKDRRINCDYDEYSENNLFNQIIKTTIYLLLRQDDVEPDIKDQLKVKLMYFSEVDTIDPKTIRWSTIRFQRNNESYRLLLGVCQMILEENILSEETGTRKIKTFEDLQRMDRLYEKFLLEYYRREWPQFTVTDSWIDWATREGESTDMLPGMHSDIMLTYKNRCLILDAKLYKKSISHNSLSDRETLISGNLYQIFAYVKNKELEKNKNWDSVSGILMYAKTEDELQPDNIYHIGGNVIGAKNLDLNQDFTEIRKALDKVANDFIRGDL